MERKPRPGELILHDPPPRRQHPKEITLDEALEALPAATLGGALKIRDQERPKMTEAYLRRLLKQEWCECGPAGAFLCYPENGACSCGEWKHHVHCICGGISQTG